MSRKVALSPLQNRIMWTLEEAGEETVTTVKATVRAGGEVFDREIEALQRMEFIQRATRNGETLLVLTARGREALTT